MSSSTASANELNKDERRSSAMTLSFTENLGDLNLYSYYNDTDTLSASRGSLRSARWVSSLSFSTIR